MPRSRTPTGAQLPAGGDPRPRRDKAFSRRRPRSPAAGGASPCPALLAPAAMRRGSPGLRSLPPCRPRRRSGGVGGSGRHGAGSWRRRSPAAEPPSILCAEEQSRPLPTPPPPPHPPRPGGAASPGGGTPAERGRGGAGRRPPPAGAAVAAQPGRRGMAAVASPAAAAAQRTWLLPPFPLCERAATLAHTLSHCSRGRAGGRRGEVGGSGGEEDGGDQRAFSACPSPGGAVEAPARTPRSLARPAELRGPGAASPAPGRAAAAGEKSSPELRPRPPERLLCCSAPLALFSRSRLPSAMLQPGGRGASGAPARAPLPRAPHRPGGAARPARSPCRPAARPAAAAMATARDRVSRLRRGTARPSPPAAGDPRPLARFPSPAFSLPASLLASRRPALPKSPPAPAPPRPRGSPPGKGSPGHSPARLCVRASEPALPRAPRSRSGGGTTATAGSPPGYERAGERASALGRPSGPWRVLTRVRQSRHAALARPRAPETLPRPPARPQRWLGRCAARCTAMAERGIDTQPPHTRGAGNITLCTAPRPLAAAKPSAAPIGPGAPIVL
ncbi:unnamed protein product, partial [Coccothraustes coccothraustes]